MAFSAEKTAWLRTGFSQWMVIFPIFLLGVIPKLINQRYGESLKL